MIMYDSREAQQEQCAQMDKVAEMKIYLIEGMLQASEQQLEHDVKEEAGREAAEAERVQAQAAQREKQAEEEREQ